MAEAFRRIFRSGWKNFKRNSYLSIAAIGVMSLVLGLFAALIGFQFITSRVTDTLEGKADVSVYFNEDVTENEILDVKDELETLSSVKEITYTSREEALRSFRESRADDENVQAALDLFEDDENPLKASLNIKATDPSQYASISSFLSSSRYSSLVYKDSYTDIAAVIGRIQSISAALRNWGLIGTLGLAVIAVFVTFNTVGLTIYSQRKEIEVMRLVGASNWHIRGPYIIEGGMYGLMSAVLSLVIFYPLLYVASERLASFMPDANLFDYFTANAVQIVILMLVVGIGLGMFSSLIAIRKHLKV